MKKISGHDIKAGKLSILIDMFVSFETGKLISLINLLELDFIKEFLMLFPSFSIVGLSPSHTNPKHLLQGKELFSILVDRYFPC